MNLFVLCRFVFSVKNGTLLKHIFLILSFHIFVSFICVYLGGFFKTAKKDICQDRAAIDKDWQIIIFLLYKIVLKLKTLSVLYPFKKRGR